MKSVIFRIYAIFLLFAVICSCQRAPRVSPAANPTEALAVAPMGSPTTNSALKRKLAIFTELIDGSLNLSQQKPHNPTSNDSIAYELITALSIDAKKLPLKGIHRDFSFGHFYFSERRFIESAQFLSRVLDQNPVFPYARNLLARCFYFLGNPDRALEELEFILLNQSNDPEEFLDALFLSGMMTDESKNTNRIKINKAIKFLQSYLKNAPQSPHTDKARQSLHNLRLVLNNLNN